VSLPWLEELELVAGLSVGVADSGVTPPTSKVAVIGFSVLPGATENVERGSGDLVRRGVGVAVSVTRGAGEAVGDGVGDCVGVAVGAGLVGITQSSGVVQVGCGVGLSSADAAAADGVTPASAVPGRESASRGRKATTAEARRTRADVGTARW
jgi:hypothetical protein